MLRLGEACSDADDDGDEEIDAAALGEACADALADSEGEALPLALALGEACADALAVSEGEALPLALGEACTDALVDSEGDAPTLTEVDGDTGDALTLGDAWLDALAGGDGETDALPLLGTGGGPAYVRTTAVAASMLRKRLEPVSATSSAYGGAAVAARPEGALNSAPPAPPGGEKTPTPSRRPAFGGGPCHWPAKTVAVADAVTCQITLQ